MTKEETDLIIAEQNKSTEEILKVIDMIKADFQELCDMRQRQVTELEKKNTELEQENAELKEKLKPENCLKLLAKEGIEFGYNKANEWHYVKDGDYPKDTKTVLALCIVGGEPYPYLAQYWKGSTTAKKNGIDLNWNCWLNNMQREVVEPYAWKEIVLPKEIE